MYAYVSSAWRSHGAYNGLPGEAHCRSSKAEAICARIKINKTHQHEFEGRLLIHWNATLEKYVARYSYTQLGRSMPGMGQHYTIGWLRLWGGQHDAHVKALSSLA